MAQGSRWYPSPNQLKDPVATERSFRQVLDHLYRLQDSHDALTAKVGAAPGTPEAAPTGSGPADTKLCGLFVEPVDATTLSDGATLKFNKARSTFSFQ